jgi:hypothetical protein
MADILHLKRKTLVARMECSKCGAPGTGTCDCGAPYVPAGQRAKAAVAAHPEKSDRAIAEEIGVGKDTVRRARVEATGANAPVDSRTGKDGKVRKLPGRRVEEPEEPEDHDEADELERLRSALVIHASTAAEMARKISCFITRNPEILTREAKKAIREAAHLWFQLEKKA